MTSCLISGCARAWMEAGLYGARASIIGGCNGTSNVEAEYRFDTVSKERCHMLLS